MKLSFDEQTWGQLEEHLKVAQLCGEAAGNLYGHAKGVAQRVVSTVGMEKDVPAAEAEHALSILLALRNSTNDAARGFAAAAARLDQLIGQFEPASRTKTRAKA